MPYHHPKNRPNQPSTQRTRLTRESDLNLIILDARKPTDANPSSTAKTPRESPPFLKPSTCPSRKKVARTPIPTLFTAHCHPAYQVSMNPGDTPPLRKLGVSSLTYPPLVRHLPATYPPSTRRLECMRRERPIGSLRAFDIFAARRSVHPWRKSRRGPCGQSSATRAAAGDKFPKRPMPALKLSAMARR